MASPNSPTSAEFAAQTRDAGKLVGFAANTAESLAQMAPDDPQYVDAAHLLRDIMRRKGLVEPEQVRLRALFRRMDNLYYPTTHTSGGADHWPEAKPLVGREHISNNIPPVYVDIPASLQAVPPIEAYVPRDQTPVERINAELRELLYFAWLEEEMRELKDHQACTVKGLYGFTYGKVYWDSEEGRPTVQIIDTPENLYVGWGTSDYRKMDWVLYTYGISPISASDEYGLEVDSVLFNGDYYPFVKPIGGTTHDDPLGSVWGGGTLTNWAGNADIRNAKIRDNYEKLQVEVYDYWYKKPGTKGKVQIWNAIFVGNHMVENAQHREYDGELPFKILPNTYIPGSPYGRPELYDLEQMIREKDEQITRTAQMVQSIIGGQMWQITGADAPEDVGDNVIPRPNKVIAPGPGNKIEAIQPFLPVMQLEEFTKRIDNELEIQSGLNDLLIGKAPPQVLGSSKAISALIANYESRIRIKRLIYYQWRKDIWTMAAKIWEYKDKEVKALIDGHYRLHIEAPELSPRDQLELANMAVQLVGARVWSMERGMRANGVDLPHSEKAIIREEQTDASLNPAAVQGQMQLLATAQSLGVQDPGQQQASAPQNGAAQAANTARQTNQTPPQSQSLNGPENNQAPPAGSETPPPGGGPAPTNPGEQPASGPYGAGGLMARAIMKGGNVKSELRQQSPI